MTLAKTVEMGRTTLNRVLGREPRRQCVIPAVPEVSDQALQPEPLPEIPRHEYSATEMDSLRTVKIRLRDMRLKMLGSVSSGDTETLSDLASRITTAIEQDRKDFPWRTLSEMDVVLPVVDGTIGGKLVAALCGYDAKPLEYYTGSTADDVVKYQIPGTELYIKHSRNMRRSGQRMYDPNNYWHEYSIIGSSLGQPPKFDSYGRP